MLTRASCSSSPKLSTGIGRTEAFLSKCHIEVTDSTCVEVSLWKCCILNKVEMIKFLLKICNAVLRNDGTSEGSASHNKKWNDEYVIHLHKKTPLTLQNAMYQQHEHVNVNWLSEFIGYVSCMKCQRHVLMVTCVWIFDPGYCYSKWRQLEAHSSLRGCKT